MNRLLQRPATVPFLLTLSILLLLSACQSTPPTASGDDSPEAAPAVDEPAAPAERDAEQETDAAEEQAADDTSEDMALAPSENEGDREQPDTEEENLADEEAPPDEEPAPSEELFLQDDPPPSEVEPGDSPETPPDAPSEEDLDLLSDPDSCLYDTWIADNDSYLAFYQDMALMEGAESSPFTDIDGTMALTLTESHQWTFESDLTVTLIGGPTSDVQHSGAGVYIVNANDGRLLFEGDSDTTVLFYGATYSTTDSGEEVGWVDYTCERETLMLGALLYHRE